MALHNGWDIDLEALPGFAPPPEWWHGPAAILVEIPDSSLAFVAYNFIEIGVATTAANFSVFRDKHNPTIVFSPQYWLVVWDQYAVRCNRAETFLLVYIANARQERVKYGLVNLSERTFARVFIPNRMYRYNFTQIDEAHFEIHSLTHDATATCVDRFVIDAKDLKWFPYGKRDGFDNLRLPDQERQMQEKQREALWELRDKIFAIASASEDTTIANRIADGVLRRIERGKVDQDIDLRELVEEERANLGNAAQ